VVESDIDPCPAIVNDIQRKRPVVFIQVLIVLHEYITLNYYYYSQIGQRENG